MSCVWFPVHQIRRYGSYRLQSQRRRVHNSFKRTEMLSLGPAEIDLQKNNHRSSALIVPQPGDRQSILAGVKWATMQSIRRGPHQMADVRTLNQAYREDFALCIVLCDQ